MLDAYRYEDFAFWLEDNLKIILTELQRGDFRPKPLLKVDVPKSSLAVRPGSVVDIEDRVVLFAITCLIAPIIYYIVRGHWPSKFSYEVKVVLFSKQVQVPQISLGGLKRGDYNN